MYLLVFICIYIRFTIGLYFFTLLKTLLLTHHPHFHPHFHFHQHDSHLEHP